MSRLKKMSLLLAALAVATLTAAPAQAAKPASDVRMMVWELPGGFLPAGATTFQVEVLKNGEVVYTESATVDVAPLEGSRGIEVLAASPENRELFAVLSDRGNVTLEARLLLAGEELARVPLSTLLERGAAMAEEEIKLLPLSYEAAGTPEAKTEEPALFAITAEGTDCSARNACLNSCWDQYYNCVEYFCGGPGGPLEPRRLPLDCDFCMDERFLCNQNCPSCTCTEPKSVTYSDSAQIVAANWAGTGCYEDWSWTNDVGYWYDYYHYTYKITHYKHTTACNGTVTTTIESISYQYSSCWDQSFATCWYPTSLQPYPQCY